MKKVILSLVSVMVIIVTMFFAATTASAQCTPPTINFNPPTSGLYMLDCGDKPIVFSATVPNPNTYSWVHGSTIVSTADTVSATSPGVYYLTVVDQNGCSNTSDMTINENPKPDVTIQVGGWPIINDTVFVCENSYGYGYWLYANIANAPYGTTIPKWDNNYTSYNRNVMQSGHYSTTVMSPYNCSDTSTIYLKVNTTPTPEIIASGSTSFCQGANLILKIDSTYAGYNWNYWLDGNQGGNASSVTVNSSTAIGAVEVYLTVTDTYGCMGSDTIEINIVEAPAKPTVIASSNDCSLMASLSGYWYQWYKSGVAITGATTQYYFNHTGPGFYWVTVDKGIGTCKNTSEPIWSDCISTGMDDLSKTGKVEIYPQPFVDNLTLRFPDNSEHSVEMMDMTGKVVSQATGSRQIMLSQKVNPGIYFLKVDNLAPTKIVAQ